MSKDLQHCHQPGCSSYVHAKNLCEMHYRRSRNGSDLRIPRRLRIGLEQEKTHDSMTCHQEGCAGKRYANKLCRPHYRMTKTVVQGPSRAYRDAKEKAVCFVDGSPTTLQSPVCRKHLRHLRMFGWKGLKALAEHSVFGCAICGDKDSQPAVDHDHKCCTGRKPTCGRCVRSALCMRCNTALGSFRDDKAVISAALEYVERWDK